MTATAARAPAGPTDLTRLIEAEARFEAALAQARREAARLVAEARAEAAGVEARGAGETAAARKRLTDALDDELARGRAAIAASAARDSDRYGRVSPERIAALAGMVLRRLVSVADDAP